MIRRKLLIYLSSITLLSCIFQIKANAQCTPQATENNATIIIPIDLNPLFNGSPLPFGSAINAVFDNNGVLECAGSTIWEGETTFITAYGLDTDNPGYASGELLKFQIEMPSGCIITDIQTTYLTGTIFSETGSYETDGISGFATLEVFSNLTIAGTVVDDVCNAGIGSIEVEGNNGQTPYNYQWNTSANTALIDGIMMGDYIITLTDDSGCSLIDTFTVENQDCPSLQAIGLVNGSQNTTGCAPFTVNFEDESISDTGITSWNWDFGNGDNSNSQNSSYTYDIAGNYTASLTVCDEFQCNTTTFNIVVVESLDIEITGDTDPICANTTINLETTSLGGCISCNYIWSNGATTQNIQPLLSETSTFSVTVTDGDCIATDNISISVLPNPVFELSGGQMNPYCPGETETLQVFTSADNGIEWNTGDISPTIEVTESGSFMVTVTDDNNCNAVATIDLVFLGISNDSLTASSQEICAGTQVILSTTGENNYEWIDPTGTLTILNNSSASISPNEFETYGVIISNECFTDTLFQSIYVFPNTVEFPQDTTIFQDSDLVLSAEGASVEWAGNTDFLCSICNETTISPDSNLTVFVTVVDEFDCTYNNSFQVTILDNLIDLFKPINIISPNFDQFNDFLVFEGLEKFPNNRLKIFNRWGNIIFEQLNYQNDWFGTYNGEELPAGDYYYILTVNSDEQIIKSVLTIIRE